MDKVEVRRRRKAPFDIFVAVICFTGQKKLPSFNKIKTLSLCSRNKQTLKYRIEEYLFKFRPQLHPLKWYSVLIPIKLKCGIHGTWIFPLIIASPLFDFEYLNPLVHSLKCKSFASLSWARISHLWHQDQCCNWDDLVLGAPESSTETSNTSWQEALVMLVITRLTFCATIPDLQFQICPHYIEHFCAKSRIT